MQASPNPQASVLPEIPGYQFLEQIGEGGTGTVYRALQLSLQRTVAIKILDPAVHEQAVPESLQRESQLMATVIHPNIVAVHDCGFSGGRPYIVMEDVPGTSLRAQMVPGVPWKLSRALPLLDTIGQALSAIHEKGILHLDLKPENVLLSQTGHLKITDFGLALLHVDARSRLQLNVGTIDYCAPEQRHGLHVDHRSDLFSYATLAYELLTGRLPGRVYRSARNFNPEVTGAMDGALRRALARDPDDRYASVEAFRRDLVGSKSLAERWPLSYWTMWAVLIVVLMLFVLSLGSRFLS